MLQHNAYHVVPRFTGFPLYGRRAPAWHWWLSNAGLALMVAGFGGVANADRWGTPLVSLGGTLSALGGYTFAYVMWRTMDGPSAQRPTVEQPSQPRRSLPISS